MFTLNVVCFKKEFVMFLYKLYLKFIVFWRKTLWQHKPYKIIPFGTYCLPRVITTLNGFKPKKREGEESFPFDLCFSNFDTNLELLSSNFSNFYTNLEYNLHDSFKNCWTNPKLNLIFNHDNMPTIQEFIQRYDNRIKNLYKMLNDKDKYLYFMIATFEQISNKKINLLVEEIAKYREITSFSIIVINQSKEKMIYKNKNVFCVDLSKDTCFNKINKKGDWASCLKHIKNCNAIRFNHKISKQILKIIKKTI